MARFETLRRMMGMAGTQEPTREAIPARVEPAGRPPSVQAVDEYQKYLDDIHSGFSEWNGNSVADLFIPALKHLPELASEPALADSVPMERRGMTQGARDSQKHLGHDNPEWFVVESIGILAVDKAGKAIVVETIENGYTGAEGEDFRVMDAKLAFETQDRYRREAAEQMRAMEPATPKAGVPPIASKGPDDIAPGMSYLVHGAGRHGGR